MTDGPNFERMRQALYLQGEPDRVPLGESAIDEDIKRAFLGGKKEGVQGEVDFWHKAGYDYVIVNQGLRLVIKGSALPGIRDQLPPETRDVMTAIRVGHRAKYGHYREQSTRQWANEGTGVIGDMEDFEAFPWPRAEQLDYSALDSVSALLPAGMKIIAGASEIISLIYLLLGEENFYLSVYEQPELIEKIYEKVGTIQLEATKRILAHESVQAIWASDDIAYGQGFFVSPKHLRQYLFPWFKEMGTLCKRAGKPFILHSDGKIYDVLDDIVDCGFSAIHPIEPKAMDIGLLKERWGKKLALIGNIDLGYTLTRGTPQEVEAEVKERLRAIAPGGGYCLGSSNSVTDFVPIENFNAMREATFRHGRYPIEIT